MRIAWKSAVTALITAASLFVTGVGSASAAGCKLGKGVNDNDIGCDFRGVLQDRTEVVPLDLRSSSFPSANFSSEWTIINFADFRGSIISKADFGNAWVTDSKFGGARAIGTNFRGTHLAFSDFSGANLMEADFTDADLTGVTAFDLDQFSQPAALPAGWVSVSNWPATPDKRYLLGPYMGVGGVPLANLRLTGQGASVGRVCGRPASLPANWAYLRMPVDGYDPLEYIGTKYDCNGILIGPGTDLRATKTVDSWGQEVLQGIDLSNRDLRSYNLAGANLTGANLSGSNLSGVNLQGANLADANLSSANLGGANLTYTKFERANLEGAKLSKARLDSAVLKKAKVISVKLDGASLNGVDLSGATFSGNDLTGAYLFRIDAFDMESGQGTGGAPDVLPDGWKYVNGFLVGAGMRLYSALLSGADLRGVDLSRADLMQTDFSGADLTGANLAGAAMFGTNFAGAVLTGVKSSGVTLGTRWEYGGGWSRPVLPGGWTITYDTTGAGSGGWLAGPGADLAGASLTNVDLACTDLTGAKLDDLSSSGVFTALNPFTGDWAACRGGLTLPPGWLLGNGHLIGPKANLAGINAGGLDLSKGDLTGVKSGNVTGAPSALPALWKLVKGYFVGPSASLRGVSLAGADLSGLDLSKADLTGADLTGANLASTNLSSADLTGAKLNGARIGLANLASAKISGISAQALIGAPAALPLGWRVLSGMLVGGSANLAGANLAGVDLSNQDLRSLDLSGANLRNAKLTGAKLGSTNLGGADLTGATLTGASLDGTDLTGAKLAGNASGSITATRVVNGATVTLMPALPTGWVLVSGLLAGPGSKLAGANLTGANLTGADLTGADLTGVTSGAIFPSMAPAKLPTGWRLTSGYLVGPGANLTGASFSYADFTGVSLAGTRLTGATINGISSSRITGTPASMPTGWRLVGGAMIGRGATVPAGTNLGKARLAGLNLTAFNGPGVELGEADLSNTTLLNANLSGANLTGADLSGASATSAFFTGANLTRADLTQTSFSRASLRDARITSAKLGRASLSTANLIGLASGSLTGTPASLPAGWKLISRTLVGPAANLADARLASADLGDMDLSSANLAGADLTGADLSGTLLYGARLAEPASNASPARAAILRGVKSGGITVVSQCGPSRCSWVPPLPAGWILAGGYLVGPGANLSRAKLGTLDLSTADLTDVTGSSITGTPRLPQGWLLVAGRFVRFTAPGSLSNLNLTGVDLRQVDLNGIRSSNLTGTALLPAGWGLRNKYIVGPRANLASADLSSADLTGLNLSDADLRGANLTSVKAPSVDMTRANLAGATVTSANLASARLTNANLGNANLGSANLTGAVMSAANLAGATLRGATVTNIDLSNANITNVVDGGLVGTTSPYKMPRIPTERFGWMYWQIRAGYLIGPGVNLAGANLAGADLSGLAGQNAAINLRGANLEGANLTGANLDSAILWKANLKDANLTNANLKLTGLAGADMSRAKITGANVDSANFRYIFNRGRDDLTSVSEIPNPLTKLDGIVSGGLRGITYMFPEQMGWTIIKGYVIGPKADLRNADLRDTTIANGCYSTGINQGQCEMGWIRDSDGKPYFQGIDLSGADLRNADLRGATIRNVQIGDTNFRGANMERMLTQGNEGSPILPTQLNYFGDAYKSWDGGWRPDYHPYMTGRFWVFDGGSGSIIGPGVALPDGVQVAITTRNIDGGIIYPIYGKPDDWGSWSFVDCSRGPRPPGGAIAGSINQVTDEDLPGFLDQWGCRDSNSYFGEPFIHRPLWPVWPRSDKPSNYLPKSGDDLKQELWDTANPLFG